VYALAMGHDGVLYVGGSMTGTLTGGGAVSSNVCAYDGAGWYELVGLVAGASSKVRCLAIGADNRIYAGGDFNTGGLGYVAVYTAGSGWDYLGDGLDGEVSALLWSSKGTLIAAGDFTGGVAEWNGMNWTVLGELGVGTIGGSLGLATLAEGPDGTLYAGGHLGEADGLILPDRMAQWNGSMWFPLDGNFPDSDVGVLTVNADGVVTFGGSGTGTATVAGVTTVTNNGSADAFPRITVSGPGRLYNITNWTTGESLYFDLTLIDGETLTIDLSPGVKAVMSDWRGNLLRTLLPGSRLASWHLAPGENVVGVFGGGSASMVWWERWWGV
jgi:WD40 repeat protein